MLGWIWRSLTRFRQRRTRGLVGKGAAYCFSILVSKIKRSGVRSRIVSHDFLKLPICKFLYGYTLMYCVKYSWQYTYKSFLHIHARCHSFFVFAFWQKQSSGFEPRQAEPYKVKDKRSSTVSTTPNTFGGKKEKIHLPHQTHFSWSGGCQNNIDSGIESTLHSPGHQETSL